MRILYASMMLPYPPTFGKRMEIWNCLRALAADDHEVTLVSFNDSGQQDVDARALRTLCREIDLVPVELSGLSPTRNYGSRVRSLFTGDPHDARRFRSRRFRECVERRLKTGGFDALICGEVFLMENIPWDCEVPIILKKDHIASTILKRYAACERNPAKKIYGLIEYAKMHRWEEASCQRAAAIMACSEMEAEELQQMCPGKLVTTAPNVVDLAEYRAAGREDGNTVLYHGLMDWHPNQDAVAFFISAILPRLRRMVPDVRFVVAGRSSSDKFSKRFGALPGVTFLGTVEDMRAVIEQCAVCVVPLRIASGTRFKILEAAAMEKAVVSTTIGAEGLNLHAGREILLADEPETFARHVAELLENPERRHAIGSAARQCVETLYSFPVFCRSLRETLRAVVGRRVPTANA